MKINTLLKLLAFMGLFALLSLLPAFMLADGASGTTQDGFVWEDIGGSVQIDGYTGPGGDVSIPAQINSETVTNIAYAAFASKPAITSVSIPAGVTVIGQGAFSQDANLKSFSVAAGSLSFSAPDGVLLSKDGTTLVLWPGGKAVSIPSVTTIGDYAFYKCLAATGNISLPNSVAAIGAEAFDGTAITGMTIDWGGSALGAINYGAFEECTALASFQLPRDLHSIGMHAFEGCTNLVDFAFNTNLQSIGNFAFYGDVKLGSGSQNPSGLFISCANLTVGASAFEGCTGMKSMDLNAAADIGARAFRNCTGLQGISLGDNVKSIGDQAFDGCANLIGMDIPYATASISSTAFIGCAGLLSIYVDPGNSKFSCEQFGSGQDFILFNKAKTTVLCFPEGLSGTFVVPPDVSSVGDDAFYGCSNLHEVDFPSASLCTAIGNGAFEGCSTLTVVTLPQTLQTLGVGAFMDCTALQQVAIPPGVKEIKDNTFANCSHLSNLNIGNNVSAIDINAFYHCTALTKALLPTSLATLGDQAFKGCPSLHAAYFDLGVNPPSFGSHPFDGAASDFKIYYSVSVEANWAGVYPGGNYVLQAYTFAHVELNGGSITGFPTYMPVNGDRVADPGAPAKSGLYFAGWYHDAAFAHRWDFVSDVVNMDRVDFYAKWATFDQAAPTGLKAASKTYSSVLVSWDAMPGASGYEVARCKTLTGTYTSLGTTANTSLTDTGLTTNTTYYYKVRAYINGSAKTWSQWSDPVSSSPLLGSPASVAAASASYSSVRITWAKVSGASGYEVWRCTVSATGTFTYLATATSRSYTDAGLASGAQCWYEVRAYRTVSGNKVYGNYSAVVTAKT